MKTKDFIKMLQEEDPSGECHIRMDGGFPYYVEQKLGYWDGPYSYIDENGNYVVSTKEDKIDIYCMNIDEYVYRNYDRKDPENWEKIKSKFKFELSYSDPKQRKEREDDYIKSAKESWDETNEIYQNLYQDSLNEMEENAKKGWKWFQNKDVEKNEKPNMYIYYNWKIYDEKRKEMGSNVHMTESVQLSGKWEKIDNNKKKGYYEWIYLNK